jgi:hypothetical protein
VKRVLSTWQTPLVAGLVAGAFIAYLDNFAFQGEASPIVIVAMLLIASSLATGLWGRKGWITAGVVWACVPMAHIVKHVLGLPDTLHPNTYISILYLALFTLAVVTVGSGGGVLVRRLATVPSRPEQGPV